MRITGGVSASKAARRNGACGRFYRAPEVLVAAPYDGAVDVWSGVCLLNSRLTPLFPGVSTHDQISRIADMLGPILTNY